MKALTIWQPWASLVAIGAKRIETRSWATSYRGQLAIHAASRRPMTLGAVPANPYGVRFRSADLELLAMPLGAVVATCELVDVIATERVSPPGRDDWDEGWHLWKGGSITAGWSEYRFGDLRPGRFAWLLADVVALAEPLPARGRQRLWELGFEQASALARSGGCA